MGVRVEIPKTEGELGMFKAEGEVAVVVVDVVDVEVVVAAAAAAIPALVVDERPEEKEFADPVVIKGLETMEVSLGGVRMIRLAGSRVSSTASEMRERTTGWDFVDFDHVSQSHVPRNVAELDVEKFLDIERTMIISGQG